MLRFEEDAVQEETAKKCKRNWIESDLHPLFKIDLARSSDRKKVTMIIFRTKLSPQKLETAAEASRPKRYIEIVGHVSYFLYALQSTPKNWK